LKPLINGERVSAYLFLPDEHAPPRTQTVIFFPGGAALDQPDQARTLKPSTRVAAFPFIIKDGRAVLYPVYKGTLRRVHDSLAALVEERGRVFISPAAN